MIIQDWCTISGEIYYLSNATIVVRKIWRAVTEVDTGTVCLCFGCQSGFIKTFLMVIDRYVFQTDFYVIGGQSIYHMYPRHITLMNVISTSVF